MEIQQREAWIQPYIGIPAIIAVVFVSVVILFRAAKSSGVATPLDNTILTGDIEAPQTIEDVFSDPAVRRFDASRKGSSPSPKSSASSTPQSSATPKKK